MRIGMCLLLVLSGVMFLTRHLGLVFALLSAT